MPTRLHDYRDLLSSALLRGYTIISVEQWAERLIQGTVADTSKLLVIRHDVDTHPAHTLKTAAIEKDLGVSVSYFFRLATARPELVAQLAAQGFHVSYHFEEIATVAKRHGLKSRRAIEQRMPEIQDLFLANVGALRREHGLSFGIVCSHGDWINRRIGVANHVLLSDPLFRSAAGIQHETYDAELMGPFAKYISDRPAPHWWSPVHPQELLRTEVAPLGLLIHPRQWQSWWGNFAEDGKRVLEEVGYRVRG